MTEFEKQFLINYYQWAKREFQQEIESGFPLLSKLRCSFSFRVYEFMLTLPDDEQRMFALARVKKGNPEATEMCGELMTPAEMELLESYHNRSVMEYPIVGPIRYGGRSKREIEIREAIDKKELRVQHSTKAFRTAVLARVSEALCSTPQVDEFETIKHVAQTDDWKITTSIALKGKFPMRYTQCLAAKGGIFQEASFFRWMGIMGDTLWDLVTTDVTDQAIEQLVTLCTRFLSEAPRLL
jgi:hypothetical protein